MGIEPTLFAWEAKVLPLNYTRVLFPLRNSKRLQLWFYAQHGHREHDFKFSDKRLHYKNCCRALSATKKLTAEICVKYLHW